MLLLFRYLLFDRIGNRQYMGWSNNRVHSRFSKCFGSRYIRKNRGSTHPLLGRCAMKCPSGCTAIMCTCAVTRPAATWELHQCVMGGHHGIVRAWCPVTPTTSCTAGEDALICERKNDTLRINTISSLPPDIANTSMFESEPMDNSNDSNDHRTTHRSATTATTAVATHRILGGPIRRQRRSSNTTTKPY